MIRIMRLLVTRDLRLALRQGSDAAMVIAFFVITVTLFPLGVGPEPNVLARIAAGVVTAFVPQIRGGLCRGDDGVGLRSRFALRVAAESRLVARVALLLALGIALLLARLARHRQ